MAKREKGHAVMRIGMLPSTLIGGSIGFVMGLSIVAVYILIFLIAIGIEAAAGGAGAGFDVLGFGGLMIAIVVAIYLAIFTLLGIATGAGTALIYNHGIAKISPLKLRLEEI